MNGNKTDLKVRKAQSKVWNGIQATCLALLLAVGATVTTSTAGGEGGSLRHEVLVGDQGPGDTRITDIKSYKTPQTFEAPRFFRDWQSRKEELRLKILNACGLLPMPEIGELEAKIFDRQSYDGYTIEKVFLRTYPGYYATGNLYRPIQPKEGEIQKFPGLLCPHGHWNRGRLEESELASVPRRAISFARQGYVVFTYDMVGYQDNGEFLNHSVGGDRERIWAISPAGIQTLTSLRGLDLLESLPDVDTDRLGCTGASGGGTQTFLLSGIDERVKVSAPVNMISSTMQGGCICENPTGLRLDTNNMEIGSLMAPRPMIMIAATGDWTKLTPTVEFPTVRSAYMLYGVPQRVSTYQQDAGHNYNIHSRQPVYQWFAKWFYPYRPKAEFVESADLQIPATTEMAIFPKFATPEDTLPPEQLYASIRERFETQLQKAAEGDRKGFLSGFGQAYAKTLGCSEPESQDIAIQNESKAEVTASATGSPTFHLETFLLCNSKTGQRLPAHLWNPANPMADSAPVVFIHPRGKAGILDASGYPQGEALQLLGAGRSVLSVDCFGTGEFVKDASLTQRQERSDLFATYNLTNAACRVQDILLAERYLSKRTGKAPEMMGVGKAGGWVLLAHGLANQAAGTRVDLSGVDFAEDAYFLQDAFIPNIRRAGDFVTSILLGGNRPVEVKGCADTAMQQRIERATARVQGS